MLYAIVLGFVALSMFGSYASHAGFVTDDWVLSATERFGCEGNMVGTRGYSSGFLASVGCYLQTFGDRPVLAGFFALTYGVLGDRVELHVAVAVALSVGVAIAVYVALRMVQLEARHAGAIGLLTLAFPFADTTRFWPTAAQTNLSLLLFLAGAILALFGTRRRGREAAVPHVAATVLFVLSVLTYQLSVGLVGFLFLLYLRELRPRDAVLLSLANLVPVIVATVVASSFTPKPVTGVGLSRVIEIFGNATKVLAATAWPIQREPSPLVAGFVLVVLAAVTAVAFRRRANAKSRPLLRWIWIAGLAGAWIVAGYAGLVPTEYYVPVTEGLGNRVNVAAAPGYVALIYATIMAVGLVVLKSERRAATAASLVSLVLLVGFVRLATEDSRTWLRASGEARRVLGSIKTAIPKLGPNDTVYASGYDLQYDDVPVFTHSWDLKRALQGATGKPYVTAYPLLGGSLACRKDHIEAASLADTTGQYGRAWVVDVSRGQARRLTNPQECQLLSAAIAAGAKLP